jgi:anti-sigma regulatory factor (Ser/Thr protein kinase)
LLFTDGLVETRAWGGSERGMRHLCASLEALPTSASLDQVLDTSLSVIPHGLRGDDVAVLVARMAADNEAGRMDAHRSFPALAMSVPLARSWLTGLLQGWEVGVACQDVAGLVLTELLSNAVRDAEQPVTVHVTKEPLDLLVEIFDNSHRLPISRSVTPDDPSGRGLWMVRSLAREWGVREELDGKVVWARVAVVVDLPGDDRSR